MTDEALYLLRTLLAGQREILEFLAPADAQADLVRAIAASVDDEHREFSFSVNELIVCAGTSEGEALGAAIVAAVGALNGRKLGWFLKHIEGHDFDGLRVEQLDHESRDGNTYVLRVVK